MTFFFLKKFERRTKLSEFNSFNKFSTTTYCCEENEVGFVMVQEFLANLMVQNRQTIKTPVLLSHSENIFNIYVHKLEEHNYICTIYSTRLFIIITTQDRPTVIMEIMILFFFGY